MLCAGRGRVGAAHVSCLPTMWEAVYLCIMAAMTLLGTKDGSGIVGWGGAAHLPAAAGSFLFPL